MDGQEPEAVVTEYTAVATDVDVLVNVPVILFCAVLCEKPPVKPDPVGADQVY